MLKIHSGIRFNRPSLLGCSCVQIALPTGRGVDSTRDKVGDGFKKTLYPDWGQRCPSRGAGDCRSNGIERNGGAHATGMEYSARSSFI